MHSFDLFLLISPGFNFYWFFLGLISTAFFLLILKLELGFWCLNFFYEMYDSNLFRFLHNIIQPSNNITIPSDVCCPNNHNLIYLGLFITKATTSSYLISLMIFWTYSFFVLLLNEFICFVLNVFSNKNL